MHDHTHGHHQDRTGKNILIAFFLNAFFAIIELIGGYYTNSIAIYSDALHDLGDSIALLFAYFAEKMSHKEADDKYTYGYRRFSVLAAFLNGIILLAGSIFVLYEAVVRLQNPQVVIPEGMLGLAILGIFVNGFAAFRLSKDPGMNQKMVMFHLLEDILGWIAVLIVSIVLLFKPYYILDSILSILISLIILKGVYRNMIQIGAIFLQKFPDDIKLDEIIEDIKSHDLILDVHAVKGWAIDSESFSLSLHVEVPKHVTIEVVDTIRLKLNKLLERNGVKYASIEFESSCSDLGHASTTKSN